MSSCRLAANSDVFNHTCDDVTSYLEVEYTCRDNDDIGERIDNDDHDDNDDDKAAAATTIVTYTVGQKLTPC